MKTKQIINFSKSVMPAVWLAISAGILQASTFEVDKNSSSVLVNVKATGEDFTAQLKDYDAVIQGDKDTLKPSKVTFSWDFSNLKTGKTKRDDKMLSWLENQTTASFVLDSFTKRVDGRMWAKGKMKIHGVTQVVEFPAKVIAKGDKMTIRGTAALDTRQYELPIIKMLKILKVEPIVQVGFSLRGHLR